ncbi:MAG: primosomal protein N' [Gammaproteobacteria bacterium]|jgi:primosomal protein N' (replication factor Y) (superfamily II helicase)|nr:primosomal protein N' [Gammaproteobacteria bacterium]MBT5205409.1 primosomal protein N' [Gammaproteobacteria bacterium]MBT5604134.1 primosomal protein N' [Gammaproteobacteria bacterium]MBT6245131.1 primosomal protein N' [Gammaproteobacteria bacterium]
MNKARLYLDIAVPVPIRRSFQYWAPYFDARPGIRVRVPFGNRELIGIILSSGEQPATEVEKIKPVLEVIDLEPIFSASLIEICNWAANYYLHPIGEVYFTAMPSKLRNGLKVSKQVTVLTVKETDPSQATQLLHRAPEQNKIWQLLKNRSELSSADLKALNLTNSRIQPLVNKGLLARHERTPLPQSAAPLKQAGLDLNHYQQEAISRVKDQGTYLLHGITGSGKTEVYLQLIAKTLRNGQQALILVPEISLTPQTLERFEQRFTVPVITLHSGLTEQQRAANWIACYNGSAAIIIGTRSSVFAPLLRPGLIIVDEEHDTSYKQQDGFRYSARDIAVIRGRRERVPVVLGSATPSLESLHNVNLGKYQLSSLPLRATGAAKEKYQLIDTRLSNSSSLLEKPLIKAIGKTLNAGNQVLIMINRRGYAPVLYCNECQWIARCEDCDARLTVHRRQAVIRCHHCGFQADQPKICGHCQQQSLVPVGEGTQRIEESLNNLFPDFPVLRVDSDSTHSRYALQDLLDQINQGKPAILVGTQLLAKGHHFSHVTMVIVLELDSGLMSSDFRSLEKISQLIIQAGGRSGRESRPGRVFLPTAFPQHRELKQLIGKGYLEFSKTLLAQRQQHKLPPFSFHALIRADSKNRNTALEYLDQVRKTAASITQAEILGPVLPAMEKRLGYYRAQLLVVSDNRAELHRAMLQIIDITETIKTRSVRWSLDVDPYDLY